MKLKTMIGGAFSLGSGVGSAAISLDDKIAAWLRITALLVGIVGAAVSAYWVHKVNKGRSRQMLIEEQVLANRLCFDCRAGRVPNECPIPAWERPHDCPLRKGGDNKERTKEWTK